jgi:outer membrane receptor for Fe3+-dicitrate
MSLILRSIPRRFSSIRATTSSIRALGATWTPRADLTTFAAWSYASREPAFRDLYDAEGVGSVPLYADAAQGTYNDPLIKPEHVHDFEVGSSWHRGTLALTGNLFRMNFSDELSMPGNSTRDLGYAITGNAARSIHQGFVSGGTLRMAARRGTRLLLDGNATLSDNHFVEYSEFDELGNETRYDGKAIGFFPARSGMSAHGSGGRSATIGAATQLVGRMYLDNTEDRAGSIAPHAVLNLIGAYRLARAGRYAADVSVRVFNVAG